MKDVRLDLVKSGEFLGTVCDFYRDEDDNIYMTRNQIGEALQYSNSRIAISNIHERNKDRLDKFSTELELSTLEGNRMVARDTILYIEKGIYDICRFSRQPLANKFYDWVYDQVILIRKTGGAIDDKDLFIETYCGGLDQGAKTIVKSFMSKVEEQQATINKIQPDANNWKAYGDSEGNITMANVAKSLNIKGIGRNNLFKVLKQHKILRKNNEPYQRFVDSNYFEVIVGTKNGHKYNQTVVTDKGMGYINKKMTEWGY